MTKPIFIRVVDGVTININTIVSYVVDASAILYMYKDKIYHYDISLSDESIAPDDIEAFESTMVTIYFTGSIASEQNTIGLSAITLLDKEADTFIYRLENSAFIELIS